MRADFDVSPRVLPELHLPHDTIRPVMVAGSLIA
jgi:hypothetical protein